MDGFTGFKTAAAEQLPDAVEVMAPFRVIQLVGDRLDRRRQRVQYQATGQRGRAGAPLYGAHRTLHTGAELFTGKLRQHLETVFTDANYVAVEVTWSVYQEMSNAYCCQNRTQGKELMQKLITELRHGTPAGLEEVRTLGKTIKPPRLGHIGLLR